jgi:putative hydrolase of the HAD superfamily
MEALALAGVQPERAVMVGDSYESDVLGAQRLGMSSVLVNRWGVPEGAKCPVIDSLSDLPTLLGTHIE